MNLHQATSRRHSTYHLLCGSWCKLRPPVWSQPPVSRWSSVFLPAGSTITSVTINLDGMTWRGR